MKIKGKMMFKKICDYAPYHVECFNCKAGHYRDETCHYECDCCEKMVQCCYAYKFVYTPDQNVYVRKNLCTSCVEKIIKDTVLNSDWKKPPETNFMKQQYACVEEAGGIEVVDD